MDANARYLFDLQGYCVIPNAMTEEQLARANAAIDANMHTIQRRGEQGRGDLSGNSPALKREQGRGDIGGAMTWPGTHGEIFRELLAHPTSTAALLEVFDDGFRLDHMYGILMTAGTEGHTMHGGGHTERPGAFYRYRDGQMRCGLTVASWQLTDQMEGDGGFAVVPGSHKGNIAPPASVVDATDGLGVLKQVVAPAGSLVIFTEALLHGTLPWTAAHERRSMLYKFAPGPITYANIAPDQVADSMEAAIGAPLTPQQRALLLGPHAAQARPSHAALAAEAAKL